MAGKARDVILQTALLVVLPLIACAQTPPAGLSRAEARSRAAALTQLGKKLFFDTALSGSGKLSCASCHDPRYAFGPPPGLPLQNRAVPSLRYLQVTPQFTEHFFDSEDNGDDSVDNGPTGGLTWDGRVDRGRDQARIPLLSPQEMANASPAAIVAKLRKAPYADDLRRLVGDAAFSQDSRVFSTALESLEVYQQDADEFYPYTSKFDAWLSRKTTLTEQEQRGLKLFEDPAKGNCASCHRSRVNSNGTAPQFTDYGMIALGVPRNPALAANANPRYFDMGLCGPLRTDLKNKKQYCGRFITPSLRNAATRSVFFHNGVVPTLREAVAFYVERDTKPEKIYPHGQFDDLPRPLQKNLNQEPPFGRHAGDQAVLSDSEIDDIIAFVKTLTDGWE